MVEFSLIIGLLMLLVVLTVQLAIYLHYRSSLDLVAREGAFEATLAGHRLQDGELAANTMWERIQPGAGPISISVTRSGHLVFLDATGYAPAIVPVPFPPFNRIPVRAHAVHTVEQFQAGAGG
jgi:hypothetical protein